MKPPVKTTSEYITSMGGGFCQAIRDDLRHSWKPLQALWSGWRKDGFGAACLAFVRAQRENFPQGLFAALILISAVVMVFILLVVTLQV